MRTHWTFREYIIAVMLHSILFFSETHSAMGSMNSPEVKYLIIHLHIHVNAHLIRQMKSNLGIGNE